MAIVIGHPMNKIHIYSLVDFQLKFCLDSEFQQQKIINISISKKNKFFSILYNDYNLDIYNLTSEKKVNQNCKCMKDLLLGNDDMGISGKKKKETFFSKTFNGIKVC